MLFLNTDFITISFVANSSKSESISSSVCVLHVSNPFKKNKEEGEEEEDEDIKRLVNIDIDIV
jgi:hypothetical protein